MDEEIISIFHPVLSQFFRLIHVDTEAELSRNDDVCQSALNSVTRTDIYSGQLQYSFLTALCTLQADQRYLPNGHSFPSCPHSSSSSMLLELPASNENTRAISLLRQLCDIKTYVLGKGSSTLEGTYASIGKCCSQKGQDSSIDQQVLTLQKEVCCLHSS